MGPTVDMLARAMSEAWIFWTMTHHDAHHGGELGVLRDPYRLTHGERVHGSG